MSLRSAKNCPSETSPSETSPSETSPSETSPNEKKIKLIKKLIKNSKTM